MRIFSIPSQNKNNQLSLKGIDGKNILIVKRSQGVGDVIMVTPVLHRLRQLNPDAYIIFQTRYPELLRYNEDVDKIIENNENYHTYKTIDLNWTVETDEIGKGAIPFKQYVGVDRVRSFYNHAGIPWDGKPQFQYKVVGSEKLRAENKWKELEGERRIVCAFFCQSYLRCYHLPHIIRVIEYLLEQQYAVMILGTDYWETQSKDFIPKKFRDRLRGLEDRKFVNLMSKTELREASALINSSDLLITVDSGLLHIAGALGKKTLALFGNMPPELRIKYYPKCEAIYNEGLPCVPCYNHCYPTDTMLGCLSEGQISAPCMVSILPKMVMAKIEEIL